MKFSSLLKAETERVWSRPVLELTSILVFLLSLSVAPLVSVIPPDRLQAEIFSKIVGFITLYADSLTLFLGLICAVLGTLSFAKDYEQGLLQTLLSLPLSRSLVFVSKLIAVTVPITLIAWVTMVFSLSLSFYFALDIVFRTAFYVLPIIFIISLLSFSLATLISLLAKRILPSILASTASILILFMISNPPMATLGDFRYLAYTPLRAPVMTLIRVFGESYFGSNVLEALPETGTLLTLSLTYALVPLFFAFLYFTRKLEIKQ